MPVSPFTEAGGGWLRPLFSLRLAPLPDPLASTVLSPSSLCPCLPALPSAPLPSTHLKTEAQMSPSGPGGQEQGWLWPGVEPAQKTMLLPLENSLKLRRTPQLEGLGEPASSSTQRRMMCADDPTAPPTWGPIWHRRRICIWEQRNQTLCPEDFLWQCHM